MKTDKMELNLSEMEKAAGGGLILKPYNPYSDPLVKSRKAKSGDKQ